MNQSLSPSYRGRLAPSPTGYLHLGHARTFWAAHERARAAGGVLVLRDEDLDAGALAGRVRRRDAGRLALARHRVAGGAGRGRPVRPLPAERAARPLPRSVGAARQERTRLRLRLLAQRHRARGLGAARGAGRRATRRRTTSRTTPAPAARARGAAPHAADSPAGLNWRFRVPDGEEIVFEDLQQGRQGFVAGRDFGDFVVWRRDDVPAYQLAVVVDDALMRITEVVRGADLLSPPRGRCSSSARSATRRPPTSTATSSPTSAANVSPSATSRSRSVHLRAAGVTPEEVRARFRP